ncbi:MAG: type III-A CRISPR-associated RAMP protein Csm3 [Candidatus Brocadia sp. WS118]|nr:MAG: type III-A CRISPR-associated RAMP protein Csm3 [Candidatus Brocadia sp. WS118]
MNSIGYKVVTGNIKCITGLRIGGSSNTIEIGGLDNPIIKSPIDDWPYIPGSSIKGKIRSLLEWDLGIISPNGDPHSCKQIDCIICRIFGNSEEVEKGPSRGIFRDASLTDFSKKDLQKMRETKGLVYGEIKYENRINRLKGKAEHPRPMERVPAGTDFSFRIDYRVFDINDNGKVDTDNFKWLLHGLWLLEQDALGGSGSRGYGQIQFGISKDGKFIPGKVFVDNKEEDIKDRYQEITGKNKRV